jgi:hypothetical protein
MNAAQTPPQMTKQQQLQAQQFAKMLEETTLAFSGAIDTAMTVKGLELTKLPHDVVATSQLSALLLTAARRTVRGGFPDIMLFTALRETLTAVRKEMAEEAAASAASATNAAPSDAPAPTK